MLKGKLGFWKSDRRWLPVSVTHIGDNSFNLLNLVHNFLKHVSLALPYYNTVLLLSINCPHWLVIEIVRKIPRIRFDFCWQFARYKYFTYLLWVVDIVCQWIHLTESSTVPWIFAECHFFPASKWNWYLCWALQLMVVATCNVIPCFRQSFLICLLYQFHAVYSVSNMWFCFDNRFQS